MKHTHDYFILGKKSRMEFENKAEEYYRMLNYKVALEGQIHHRRRDLRRSRIEQEIDRVKTWLNLNDNLKYEA